MSVSVMVNFLGLGLLVLFVPKLTEAFGGQEINCDTATSKAESRDASLTGQARLLGLFAYETHHLQILANNKLTEYCAAG